MSLVRKKYIIIMIMVVGILIMILTMVYLVIPINKCYVL